MTNSEVSSTTAKLFAVWSVYGISSWTDAAGFLAFVVSALALGEWLWKKVFRPMAEYAGWIAVKKKKTKRGADSE